MISFSVRNKGDKKVDRVRVLIKHLGLSLLKLECEGTKPIDNNICMFNGTNAIDSLDERKVSITLQAPSPEIIKDTPLPLSVTFNIEYDYSGYRIANIPVIDGKTRTRPLGKFSQSNPSYGPILLEFGLAPKTETAIDKTIIREYWAVPNQPFEVTFDFKDIIGKARNVNISKENISVTITDPLEVSTPCNFEKKEREELEEKTTLLKPIKDVLVPETKLMCYFVSSDITEPEITASIKAEFNYTYKFELTETFTVQPLPK
jgi:hypothetical protein